LRNEGERGREGEREIFAGQLFLPAWSRLEFYTSSDKLTVRGCRGWWVTSAAQLFWKHEERIQEDDQSKGKQPI
jgi:hypothetical protein